MNSYPKSHIYFMLQCLLPKIKPTSFTSSYLFVYFLLYAIYQLLTFPCYYSHFDLSNSKVHKLSFLRFFRCCDRINLYNGSRSIRFMNMDSHSPNPPLESEFSYLCH